MTQRISMNSHKKNPWNKPVTPRNGPKSSEEKFKEAQKKLQEAILKHVKDYESSEDEEELETNNVIGEVFKNYQINEAKDELLGRTRGFLEESIISGASTCLICISTIKRTESIWNCKICYCFFHLLCIQRWSKDSLAHKQRTDTPVKEASIKWCCPKCRGEYCPEDFPSDYRCFCGKTTDPPFQSLLAPHSCGETCGKQLKPYCGHGCLLLCHPGPCPPCPKTVRVSCYCGMSPETVRRCSAKEWSCGSPCNKPLACGKHKCLQNCHSGECPPCPKKSLQKCLCGSEVVMRDCADPTWQCEKVCTKSLECGFHSCFKQCHSGLCGDCVLSKLRTCPCGKSTYQLPCTEETPACGDTCEKLLECGMHLCTQRCHKGKCMTCVETVIKTCRCGLHEKEIQCKKLYLCETKCKQMRDCVKHTCNRKCCDGVCPPCDKPCGRTLSCRKHTCSSVCHRGPCYPCNLTETVYCRCGFTFMTVPCGRKSKTKPPKCSKICRIPTDCHHKESETHRCHYGDCPSCKQICGKPRTKCAHQCPAPCHSAVLVKIEGQKALTPCEERIPEMRKKATKCPDCVVPVRITCLGDHETVDWPCNIARPQSCGRKCGRKLACENHKCERMCHTVDGGGDGTNATKCQECDSACLKPRPEGCTHVCPKPCHPGSCPSCSQMFRAKCHCGLTQIYIPCNKWTSTEDKDPLKSCGNQCPKNYPCGHRCRANCHTGTCPDPEQCKKKVKIYCKCKRIKKEFSCETNRKGEASVACDDICVQRQIEEKQIKEQLNEEKRKEEELKNQKEIEKFEKKFHGKKKARDKRVYEESNDESFFNRHMTIIIALIVCILCICAALYTF